tara:strand:+ start:442 stop:1590 length:1149 start_codon:yes stop_codon:yes gene_type:complete
MWGNWEQASLYDWKHIAVAIVVVIALGATGIHYRTSSREAMLKQLQSAGTSSERASELEGAQRSPEPFKARQATSQEVAIALAAQADIDAYLTVATNLIRNTRSIRPLAKNASVSEESQKSVSAATSPLEVSPTSRHLSSAVSVTEFMRRLETPREDQPPRSARNTPLDLNAPRDRGHVIVPIHAISTNRSTIGNRTKALPANAQSPESSFNRPELRIRKTVTDLPALPQHEAFGAASRSDIIRAIPVPHFDRVFRQPSGNLDPALKNRVIPFSHGSQTAIARKPAKAATVNVNSGGKVQRFTLRMIEPSTSENGSILPPQVYQSQTIECTPWIVQPGQSLEELAAGLAIMPGEILDINSIGGIVAGQKIFLPIHQLTQNQY